MVYYTKGLKAFKIYSENNSNFEIRIKDAMEICNCGMNILSQYKSEKNVREVKFNLEQNMKAQRKSRITVLFFL